jgi:hypothetical protein
MLIFFNKEQYNLITLIKRSRGTWPVEASATSDLSERC